MNFDNIAIEQSKLDAFLTKNGETGQLTIAEKSILLSKVCEEYGLNPVLVPFNFILFQGKERLYLTKVGCDSIANNKQLTRIITTRHYDIETNIYTVSAMVSDDKRKEEASASVYCASYDAKKQAFSRLSGEALANAYLKTESKAKRRATLAFIGFAFEEDSFESFDAVEPLANECEAKTKAIAIAMTSTKTKEARKAVVKEVVKEEKEVNLEASKELDNTSKELDKATSKPLATESKHANEAVVNSTTVKPENSTAIESTKTLAIEELYNASSKEHKLMIVQILAKANSSWSQDTQVVQQVSDFSKNMNSKPISEVLEKARVIAAYFFEYFDRNNIVHTSMFIKTYEKLLVENKDVKKYNEVTKGTKEDITNLYPILHKISPVKSFSLSIVRYCEKYLDNMFK
jgi:hypothetical protein